MSARLGWRATRTIELSLSGSNLLHARHLEPPLPYGEYIGRSVFARIDWRLRQAMAAYRSLFRAATIAALALVLAGVLAAVSSALAAAPELPAGRHRGCVRVALRGLRGMASARAGALGIHDRGARR